MDFFIMFLKLILALVVVLGLLVVTFKVAGKGLEVNNSKKYTKIIDKTQISKDGYIVVVKIGQKGVVLSTSNGSTQKLYELSEEEVEEIERQKQQSLDEMSDKYNGLLTNIKTKVKNFNNKKMPKDDYHE